MMMIECTLSPTIVAADENDTSDDDPGPSPISLLIEDDEWQRIGDVDEMIRRAYDATVAKLADIAGRDVAVLLTSDDAVAALNAQYRGQNKPTNVLSFPAAGMGAPAVAGGEMPPLGDIAVAYQTVMREAEQEGKPPLFHLAHLTVHGLLHLAGLDHTSEAEAERMEAMERDILATIGIPDPYFTSHEEPPAAPADGI
jgi:probable rRNA maturation factor